MAVSASRDDSSALGGVANGYAPLSSGLYIPKQYIQEADMTNGTLELPSNASALATNEGAFGWESTQELIRVYDGQRERAVSAVGWVPYVYMPNFVSTAALTTAASLTANGGSLAIPMYVVGHMLVQRALIRNTDTTLTRAWRWDLYVQRLNNGNGAENTLTRVVDSNGSDSFTAAAASTRGLDATTPGTYIAPGVYWLVVQNTNASNTFGVGSTAVSSALSNNAAQTKTTTNPNGSTLDFVAATWTKQTALYAVRLDGRVFGQTTQF